MLCLLHVFCPLRDVKDGWMVHGLLQLFSVTINKLLHTFIPFSTYWNRVIILVHSVIEIDRSKPFLFCSLTAFFHCNEACSSARGENKVMQASFSSSHPLLMTGCELVQTQIVDLWTSILYLFWIIIFLFSWLLVIAPGTSIHLCASQSGR